MNERLYNRLANAFILIAIGSALAFDSAAAWRFAAGAVGIITGLCAIALYFLNQLQSPAERQVEEKVQDENKSASIPLPVHSLAWQAGIAADLQEYLIRDFLHHKNIRAVIYRRRDALRYYTTAGDLVAYKTTHDMDEFLSASGAAIEHEPLGVDDFAAYVAGVMRHLSTGRDRGRWEFTLRPEGLRVREASLPDDPEGSPQPDLDFGQTSTMIH